MPTFVTTPGTPASRRHVVVPHGRRGQRLACTTLAAVLLAVTSRGGARLTPRVARAMAATAYYQITDLGALGGDYSYAAGINNSGVVVGWAGNTIPDPIFGTQSRAVVWTGSMPTDLGAIVAGGADAYAQNINDAGEIVGLSPVSTTTNPLFGLPDSHATLWYHGRIIDLGTLGGGLSTGQDIARNGTVVGKSYLSGDTMYRATLWAHGQIHDLGTLPGGNNSLANGIDAAGQVAVGASDITTTVDPATGYPDQHAVLWQGGTIHDLGSLGGNSDAAATNGSSAVGDSYLQGNATFHPTLWAGGHLGDLGVLSGDADGQATDINSRGLIVGSSGSAIQPLHALLWHAGVMLNLNQLIPTSSGWQLQGATWINDRGQISGFGTLDGQSHGFVLTPANGSADGPTSADLGSASAGALPGVALSGRGWRLMTSGAPWRR